MIAVIFEVWPADGRKQTYLDIAAELNSSRRFIVVPFNQSYRAVTSMAT